MQSSAGLFNNGDSATLIGSLGTANLDAIKNTILGNEGSELLDSLNGAGDKSSEALTYGMYLSRNQTISNIATDLTMQNNLLKNGPSDTYARQAEINEWQAQNKFDTLFFLQCLFIYLTVFILILFLRRYDLLPSSAFYIFTGLMTIIILGILWNRAYYSVYNRDKRYWNRRYLGLSNVVYKPACDSASTGLSST